MATDKSKPQAAGASTALAALPSRCDQGGGEVITGTLHVHAGDVVRLRLVLCRASFQVIVALDDKKLVDEAPFPGDEVLVTLPPHAPGLHQLHWGYLTNAPDWKVLSEVAVNGVARFRQRKSSGSTFPFNHTFLDLEVQ